MDDFAKERDPEKFHSPRNLLLALWKGEVPRFADWKENEKIHLGEELSDVLLYLVRLSDICGIDLVKLLFWYRRRRHKESRRKQHSARQTPGIRSRMPSGGGVLAVHGGSFSDVEKCYGEFRECDLCGEECLKIGFWVHGTWALLHLREFARLSLPYGQCVDMFYNDAQWEGVIFDRKEGDEERRIYFPDMGDEMESATDKKALVFSSTDIWRKLVKEVVLDYTKLTIKQFLTRTPQPHGSQFPEFSVALSLKIRRATETYFDNLNAPLRKWWLYLVNSSRQNEESVSPHDFFVIPHFVVDDTFILSGTKSDPGFGDSKSVGRPLRRRKKFEGARPQW
ncbi:hypothetical protein HAX54_016106 [Datura stramonium]|uniref:Uncharacterized protein n=1 Tax=Datura stramonium TaxID=4076 RepID=A0ABS8S346_DATST|nr:hypothetical protein [Datura stramonium]